MKQIKLSNRLGAVAALVAARDGVVDVGTDHGYLPAWLALGGKARRIVAADIRKGPLDRARATAQESGVSDRIEFVLTDGLTGIDSAGLDTVILSGMGGETIAAILENAVWTRNPHVLCVLQPQSKTETLTAYLRESGYQIRDAALACDDDRLYLIIAAGIGDGAAFDDPLEALLNKNDPLLPAYLAERIGRARRALEGLERAEDRPEKEITQKRTELEKFNRMAKETDKWHR